MPRPLGAANERRVRELMEHLKEAFEGFCDQEEPLDYLDAFMGVHNFHKLIVFDLAERCNLDGPARQLFLQMAADTFREAMEKGR